MDLKEARVQLVRLAATSPGDYFIYSARNGCEIRAKLAPEG
jgi:hypothetical protein